MFRRKEDSLFDPATDTLQEGAESATVINPASATSSGGSASGSSSATSGSATSGSATSGSTSGNSSSGSASSGNASGGSSSFTAPSSAARPGSAESRPAAPSANAFRSSASSLGSDMSRNRMPEAKPAAPASVGMPSGVEKSNKSGRRVLTVGHDILLKGEIATCDRLVIEGKVDATLNDVHTVEIAETGSFKGAAHIEDAEISGLFEGELIVRNRLVIYGTGRVRGKISYGEIEIERGGEISGEIKTTNSAQSTGTVRSSAAARPGVKEDNKFAA